jgi:GNAT superfamily N-acetyltransferase
MFSSPEPKESKVVTINFNLKMRLTEDYQPSDFLQSIVGQLSVQSVQDEHPEKAGCITASLLQFGDAMDHGITADQLGDGISGDVAEYWELLFDVETGHWKTEIQDQFEIDRTDLLILDCIEIHPPFRRQGIGLEAIDRTIQVLGAGCGLIACKPWPLQFTPAFAKNRQRLESLQAPVGDQGEAVQKLRQYWSKAGFWPVDRSGIYVMSTSQR